MLCFDKIFTSFLKILSFNLPRAKAGEVNYSFIDRFTFVHFLIGFAYEFIGISFGWALLLAVVWELIENPLKFYLPFVFPHATADTIQNQVGDTIAVILGWLVSYFVS